MSGALRVGAIAVALLLPTKLEAQSATEAPVPEPGPRVVGRVNPAASAARSDLVVTLTSYDGTDTVAVVHPGRNGRFALQLDTAGVYLLVATTDGESARVGLLARPARRVPELRVTVSPAAEHASRDASVGPGGTEAAEFGAFTRDLFARVDAYFERRARAEAAGATRVEMREIYERYDPAPDADLLAEHLAAASTSPLRDLMTAAYLAAPLKSDNAVARRALAEIPPESRAWALDPRSLSEAMTAADRPEEARALAHSVARRNPVRDVRARALGELLADALRRHDTDDLAAYYAWLTDGYSDSKEAARAVELYDPARPIQPGRPVPDFSVASLDDPSVTVSREGLLGRVYLMDFWATWCGPCITEMRYLHEAYEQFAGDGFTILSLSFDLDPADVRRFRSEGDWPMPWLHAFVEGGQESALAARMGVVNIPRAILVGRDGRILATNEELRGERLARTLTDVFQGETAP